jgi:hypothetical protein
MPREQSKYFWPSSGLRSSVEMDLLYRARESSTPRVPITQLIARAVLETYGHLAVTPHVVDRQDELKEAA